MNHSIEIANRQRLLKLDRRRLRQVAKQTLSLEEVAHSQISIAVVDSQEMRSLNNQFLQHDYDTDVLSFLLECLVGDDDDYKAGGGHATPTDSRIRGRGKILEGEIILSAGMALEMAPKFQWSPQDELVYYLVHGLLHLAGYDDLAPEERKRMRTRERQVLAACGLNLRRSPRKGGQREATPAEIPADSPPKKPASLSRKTGRSR